MLELSLEDEKDLQKTHNQHWLVGTTVKRL